jgi:hypothetical protein
MARRAQQLRKKSAELLGAFSLEEVDFGEVDQDRCGHLTTDVAGLG